MKAELVFIGTELLLGEIENRNAVFLATELADAGIDVYYQSVVGDNLDRIVATLDLARRRSDAVIMTGGLGPTMDDATREALAKLTGRPLRVNPDLLSELEKFYASRGMSVKEGSRRQAMLPEGAEPLPNPRGTAPGIWLVHEGCIFVAMPGPPREMQPMFLDYVKPRLLAQIPSGERQVLFRRILKVAGVPEASLEERLYDLVANQKDPTIAPYAKGGEVHIRLATKAISATEAEARLNPLEEEIKRRIGWRCYGRDGDTLESVVGEQLRKAGLTLAIGESCTGGLAGARITNVPGSSAWFKLSVVAYDNIMKHNILDVPQAMLEQYGAVSEQVAFALADGARSKGAADIGLGITGIAGPGGGTPEKPVGTVYVAVTGPDFRKAQRLQLRGSREDIRHRTVTYGLTMILEYIHHTHRTTDAGVP